jgi:hypothetical protein
MEAARGTVETARILLRNAVASLLNAVAPEVGSALLLPR